MDNFYFWLRILSAAFSIFGAGALVYALLVRRSRLAARRVEDSKAWWIGQARFACVIAGMGLAAAFARDRQIGMIVGLSAFAPSLLAALVTGRFDWEADDRRIDSPARFWGWVAFYLLLCVMMTVMIIFP